MKILRLAWMCLVAIHAIIILTNIASFFALIVLAPWYIAMPCCTMIVRVLFSQVLCPLTVVENKMRVKLGLPPIDRFVSHYLIPNVEDAKIAKVLKTLTSCARILVGLE